MFREIEPKPRNEGVLRHPDGSINFDAYRERARHARTAAITASIKRALSLTSGLFAGSQASRDVMPEEAGRTRSNAPRQILTPRRSENCSS